MLALVQDIYESKMFKVGLSFLISKDKRLWSLYMIPWIYIKDNTPFFQDYATTHNRLLTPKLFSLLNHATIPNRSLVLIKIYL